MAWIKNLHRTVAELVSNPHLNNDKNMNTMNSSSKFYRAIPVIVLMFIQAVTYSQELTSSQIRYKEQKEQWDQQMKERKEKLADFPSNYVVVEYAPSCAKGTGYYFKNGMYLFHHAAYDDSEKFTLGKWFARNDTLFTMDSIEFGTRGIGSAHLVEGTHYADCPSYYYDEYVNYEKIVSSQRSEPFYLYLFPDSDYSVETNLKADADYPDYDGYFIPGQYKIASTRILTEQDLKKLTKDELRFMRNEIFARYGYKFKTADLREYFGPKSWYKPSRENVDKYLTDTEKENIAMIRLYEQ